MVARGPYTVGSAVDAAGDVSGIRVAYSLTGGQPRAPMATIMQQRQQTITTILHQ